MKSDSSCTYGVTRIEEDEGGWVFNDEIGSRVSYDFVTKVESRVEKDAVA